MIETVSSLIPTELCFNHNTIQYNTIQYNITLFLFHSCTMN